MKRVTTVRIFYSTAEAKWSVYKASQTGQNPPLVLVASHRSCRTYLFINGLSEKSLVAYRGLRAYVTRSLINRAVLFVAVLIFIFFLLRVPVFFFGVDPADMYLHPDMTDEARARLREIWGIPPEGAGFWEWLDHFTKYIRNMLTMDFGISFRTLRPVALELMYRLPNTIILMGTATTLAVLLGVYSGMKAAARHGSKTDSGILTTSLFLNSLPVFWLGMILLLAFSVHLGLFPLGGSTSAPAPRDPLLFVIDYLWHLTLPATTLTLAMFGGYMLLMRNCVVTVLTEDFITTARAKGLDERAVLYKHAFKNAFLPVLTSIGLSYAFMITGAVLTETVFGLYGMGVFFVSSILMEDWPCTQAIVFLLAVCVIAANFIVDMLYGGLDPRVRYA